MKHFKDLVSEQKVETQIEEAAANTDKIKKDLIRLLNNSYSQDEGMYGATPIYDHYQSELRVDIIEIDGSEIEVQFTVYYSEGESDKKSQDKQAKKFIADANKVVGKDAYEVKTWIDEKDPDGSGFDGTGDTILMKWSLTRSKAEMDAALVKLVAKSGLMQMVKNSDITDLAAMFLDTDTFLEELKKYIKQAKAMGITFDEIEKVYKEQ